MNFRSRKRTFAAHAFALLWAGGAIAQQPPPPAPSPAPEAAAPSPAPAAAPAPAETGSTTIDAPASGRKSAGEEMVVTGSRVRRKDLTTPAPVAVFTREQVEASGKLTIGDFLQSMPEQGNAPNFQLNTGGVNYGADGTTRINLRSLGIQRTLVLINGRRVVPGGLGASAAVDLNTIPSEAVERVEVLKDGASAVYGSDAIAGVVNIITRRTYNGTDTGATYGVSGAGDAQTFDAHLTTGRSDEKSSAIFSVRFFDQKQSWLRDRSWSQQALDYDYTPGGGPNVSGSSRTPQGTVTFAEDPMNPGHALCNGNALCQALTATGWKVGKRYLRTDSTSGPGVACGPNAAGQTSCFRPFVTSGDNSDFYNFAAANYLTIPSRTVQAFSSGDIKFPGVRAFYEASYVQRNSVQNAAPMPLNPNDYGLTLSNNSIYNPFGSVGGAQGVSVDSVGRRLVEFGNRTYGEELGTFRIVTGLDGTLPSVGTFQNWFWDVAMNYGKTSGTFTTGGSFRNSRVGSAIGPSMIINGVPTCVTKAGDPTTAIPGCSPLNLLGGPNNGSIDPSQIDYLGYTGTSRAFDALFSVGANAGGELFNLGSERPVSVALGYEFRRQSGSQIADPIVASGDSADFNFQSTNGYFSTNELYGELVVPVLANLPGVQDLEADVAGRYVNYSTFGGNFSYKFGVRYTPISDITVRGTYSTAFRAPNISELYLGATENDPAATDPCGNLTGASQKLIDQCHKTGVTGGGSGDTGLQELTRNGGNPGLKAETAKSYSVGVVLTPQMVKGLSVTVDYFNIEIDDAVGTIGTANIIAGCYTSFNDDYCNLIVRNPKNGTIQHVNDLNQNIGTRTTAGIDFSVKYGLPTPVGRFALGFDLNWLDHLDNTLNLATGAVVVNGKGNYDLGALPSIKFNVGAEWAFDRYAAGAIVRYIGSFTECSNPSDPTTAAGGVCNNYVDPMSGKNIGFNPNNRDVGSYAQVDAHVGYTLPSALGKTAFFIGMNNVFNQAPPYIYSANLANSDPSTYDYVGRYVYGRVQHRF